jgi:uncharacterized protein YecE (DUF72 family)
MAGTLYLGTSGFGYDEWRHGVFYPEGLPASRMLSYYATLFGSVEINYTFRKFPSQKVLTSWLQQTPEGFRFTLKANQRITHVRRLRDVAGEVRAFKNEAAVLGDRLGPVLFQCPPTVEYDEPLLAAFADGLPPGIAAVMEFRHASWHAAWPFLAERQIARCVADTDDAAAGPDELVWQPFGYLRLRRAAYSDSELGVWAGRIQAALEAGSDVYCYFKHEDSAAGPRMARRLEQLMAGERDSRK